MNKNHKYFQLIIVILVITCGFAISYLLSYAKPEVKKQKIKSKSLLVETVTVKSTSEPVTVSAFGTVEPDEVITIFPEVSGTVIYHNQEFTKGGIIKKGTTLIKINPIDYLIEVDQAKAAVAKANLELKLEEGRQLIAKREWKLLESTIKDTNFGEELALRIPQLQEKKAALLATQSKLKLAETNLERTEIKTPFDSVVLSESAELGQYVSTQTKIAALAGTEAFKVIVSIPYSALKWIEVPGAKAKLVQIIGNSEVLTKDGVITHILGDVDPLGRLVRLVVEIKDPFKNKAKPLLIGTYVKIELLGPKIENLFKLPREALQENSSLIVKDEDSLLELRKVNVLFSDRDNIYINEGLTSGEEVVLTSIPLAIPGTVLRTEVFDE